MLYMTSVNDISVDNAIRRIEQIPGGKYISDSELDVYDQLYINELLREQDYYSNTQTNHGRNENVSVNGSVNDTCKRNVKLELTKRKIEVVSELNNCNYLSPPPLISKLLEELFQENPSDKGYWLHVAQRWTPRAINRVIRLMIKQHTTGENTIRNPSAYFNYLIHRREKRKVFRKKIKNVVS